MARVAKIEGLLYPHSGYFLLYPKNTYIYTYVEIAAIHTYLFCKNGIESKSESDDEKCTNNRELEKSLKNISEHHHVNAKERKLSHIG